MALFDFLSGSDEAARAAEANRAAIGALGGINWNALQAYQGGALGALGTGQQASLDALRSALASETAAYTGAVPQAEAALRAGISAYEPVTTAAQTAATTLGNLGAGYQGDIDAYRDAMGLNGPEGVARAQARFTTGPGYQFAVDEATKAAANRAASLGIAGGGNTLAEISRRAQGLAGQEYGDYLTRLSGYVNPLVGYQQQARTTAAMLPYQAATFVAPNVQQGYKTLADLYTGTAGRVGGAYGAYGPAVAGVQTGYGQNVANVAGNVYQGTTGTARDITSGNIAANNLQAQAGMQDAANWWNLMGSALGGATKAFFPSATPARA
jgi:hypothetical protein